MIVKKLTIENFMKYAGINEIQFDNGNNLIFIVGKNGVGKSTIFDAILFGLYRKILRSNGINNLITHGKKYSIIDLEFEIDNDVYKVKRYINMGKRADILYKNNSIIAEGATNVTKTISKIMDMNFDLFTKTIFISQRDMNRVLDVSVLFEVLEQIYNIKSISYVNIGLDALRRLYDNKIKENMVKIDEINSFINKLKNNINITMSSTTLLANTVSDIKSDISKLVEVFEINTNINDSLTNNYIDKLNIDSIISDINNTLTHINKTLDDVQNMIGNLKLEKIKVDTSNICKITDVINTFNRNVNGMIVDLNKNIKIILTDALDEINQSSALDDSISILKIAMNKIINTLNDFHNNLSFESKNVMENVKKIVSNVSLSAPNHNLSNVIDEFKTKLEKRKLELNKRISDITAKITDVKTKLSILQDIDIENMKLIHNIVPIINAINSINDFHVLLESVYNIIRNRKIDGFERLAVDLCIVKKTLLRNAYMKETLYNVYELKSYITNTLSHNKHIVSFINMLNDLGIDLDDTKTIRTLLESFRNLIASSYNLNNMCYIIDIINNTLKHNAEVSVKKSDIISDILSKMNNSMNDINFEEAVRDLYDLMYNLNMMVGNKQTQLIINKLQHISNNVNYERSIRHIISNYKSVNEFMDVYHNVIYSLNKYKNMVRRYSKLLVEMNIINKFINRIKDSEKYKPSIELYKDIYKVLNNINIKPQSFIIAMSNFIKYVNLHSRLSIDKLKSTMSNDIRKYNDIIRLKHIQLENIDYIDRYKKSLTKEFNKLHASLKKCEEELSEIDNVFDKLLNVIMNDKYSIITSNKTINIAVKDIINKYTKDIIETTKIYVENIKKNTMNVVDNTIKSSIIDVLSKYINVLSSINKLNDNEHENNIDNIIDEYTDKIEKLNKNIENISNKLEVIKVCKTSLEEYASYLYKQIYNSFPNIVMSYYKYFFDTFEKIDISLDDRAIYVYDNSGNKINFKMLSNAQQTALALCIRLAISSVVGNIFTKTKIFIADEPIEGFDFNRIESMKLVLNKMRKIFDQIIIITHNDRLIDGLDCSMLNI